MAFPQALTPAQTITAAEDYLLVLSGIIFRARDFGDVEEALWKATQIVNGLSAIVYLDPEDAAYNQIIIGLNNYCEIYNQQMINV